MSSHEQHWILGPLTDEEKIEFFEQEIRLAREEGRLEGRKKVIEAFFEAGIGHYMGSGKFRLHGSGKEIEV